MEFRGEQRLSHLSIWPGCDEVFCFMLDIFYKYVYVLGILQELQDGIGRQQAVVKTLNVTGEEIIEQSSTADANVLKEQLGSLNTRWQEICKQLVEKKKR